MLIMLLPKKLPAARSGRPLRKAVTEPVSSGNDVAAAISTVPMTSPPNPVRTAMMSPYSASLLAVKTTTAAASTNCSHIMRR